MLNDGTTNVGRKYNATVVSSSEGYKQIALQMMATQCSDALLAMNQTCLTEISGLLEKRNDVSGKAQLESILFSVKGALSVRASVMKCLSEKLSD